MRHLIFSFLFTLVFSANASENTFYDYNYNNNQLELLNDNLTQVLVAKIKHRSGVTSYIYKDQDGIVIYFYDGSSHAYGTGWTVKEVAEKYKGNGDSVSIVRHNLYRQRIA